MARTFDTTEVMTAAVAAYEINNHTVLKSTHLAPSKVTNSNLLCQHFLDDRKMLITSEHVARAQKISEMLQQHLTLLLLTDQRVSGFVRSVIELISEPQISEQHFGLMAWAPKVADDLELQDQIRTQKVTTCADSKWIQGGTVVLDFVPFVCRYSKNYDSFFHDGHDGQGNRVQFWNRTKYDQPGKIRGRVKQHITRDHQQVTTLNYIKKVQE